MRSKAADTRTDATGSLLPGITDEQNPFYLAESRDVPPADPTSFKPNLEKRGVSSDEAVSTIYSVPLRKVLSWLKSARDKGKVVDLRVYTGHFFLQNIGYAIERGAD